MVFKRPEFLSASDFRAVLFLTALLLVGGAVAVFQKSREVITPEVIISQIEALPQYPSRTFGGAGSVTKEMLMINRININTAPIDSLVLLPGIGTFLAKRIVEHRRSYGKFDSIDDLTQVKGIGEAKLKAVRNMIGIGDE